MAFPKRAISKSKLSMYLRTQCDRELYLSLFSNKAEALTAAGLPVPLKSRPGVQLITASGREFEYDQFDFLIGILPSNVIHKSNGRAEVDLAGALKVAAAGQFILQPGIEPEEFRNAALSNLGVTAENIAITPALAGLRPDAVFVHAAEPGEYEVLPDGNRRLLDVGEKRLGLSVIDLKNITEANPSYSAEVCLYAYFLRSWLETLGAEFQDKYFVSDRVYLWRHIEMPRLTAIMKTKEGGEHANRLAALIADLDDGLVNYMIYMPSVRKFFAEDIPRVVTQGDSSGWNSVPYHVNPKCGSCDWFGNPDWLTPKDREIYDKSPDHYCFYNAELSDHLSKMGSLSKGATGVLSGAGHETVAALVDIAPSTAVLREHTQLRRDRTQIGARAAAITTNTTTVDSGIRVGGLSKYRSAEYQVVVNFDAGSGFLTGIAIRGTLFAPFKKTFPAEGEKAASPVNVLGSASFVVPKDTLTAEWSALFGFVEKFASWIANAEAFYKAQGWEAVKTQICFWEARQYEELCNAFGRHLLKVLGLPEKYQRALAWIFPAEQLMERDHEICPAIVFIRDIVDNAVRIPQRFTTTLLGAAIHYSYENLPPRAVDRYYSEPLSNAIPRERIFEIWKSTTGTVQMFGQPVNIADAMQRYGRVLEAHTRALASITARLRVDLKDSLSGQAPSLVMSIPQGMKSVAYDSKLWMQWDDVAASAAETEAFARLVARPEVLESSYKAILLFGVRKQLDDTTFEFDVSQDSTEAKLEEGNSYCVLGVAGWPAFALETGRSLGLSVDDSQATKLFFPLHKILAVTILEFDRVNRTAKVQFRARSGYVQPVFEALMESGVIPIGKSTLYVMESMPYDDTKVTREILTEIGNPKAATASREARIAMGASAEKKLVKGGDANSPVGNILWSAKELSKAEFRDKASAQALADFALTANSNKLNPSQHSAVIECAQRKLAVIWGPPGTGKTDTLAAFLHATVREGAKRKILLTAPNYRTVEELAGRLAENLKADQNAGCDFYWLYSKSREPKDVSSNVDHLNLVSLNMGSEQIEELVANLNDPAKITIVATVAHIANQLVDFSDSADGKKVAGVFDVVVIDESSQVPVTLALRPLTTVKQDGQLIVAGDHLQMPPIEALDPPKGAEYLVGSIQEYLLARFKISPSELLINYRSNQHLVDYAKTLGYPAALQSFRPEKRLHFLSDPAANIAAMPDDLPRSSAYLEVLRPERIVSALIHDDPVSSQANVVEAGLVAGIAYVLHHTVSAKLENDGGEGDPIAYTDEEFFKVGLGVVTPHKAQKALVLAALYKLFPEVDKQLIYEAVDTVERFQGGERHTIIVSFGVGDPDVIEGEERFLLQLERMNVAVSRAMAKCIVLMPKALAYHLPTDQEAAETSVAIKSYVEEFCANRMATKVKTVAGERDAEIRWH